MNKMMKKDWLALLIIPVQMLVGGGLTHLVGTHNTTATGLIALGLQAISLVVIIYFYKGLFAKDWAIFKTKFWRNLGLSFLLMIGAHGVLSIVRIVFQLNKIVANTGDNGSSMTVNSANLLMAVAISLIPLSAPLIEEVIFRYVLFYKWRGHKASIYWGLFVLQGILFGLAHYNNFGGQILLTLPYMFVGMYFALIYHWRKNIWQNITTHLLFNSISFFAALLMLILNLLGIYKG
ncbi:MAG: CPBP family intramembrane metalloprotease [Lactobacillaceae bacterium]|jgi:membrane protease YdiL (CAAX protease family)|nr:CPBP family intramembrane metalloprotease [Lactobacillaceae bacterium]